MEQASLFEKVKQKILDTNQSFLHQQKKSLIARKVDLGEGK